MTLRTECSVALVLSMAGFARAQDLSGLRVEGPDMVVESTITNYRAIAEFDDGSEFDVTLFAALSVDPGLNAAID